MVDDPSLITAARGGDQRGYAALYRHHHRRALHEAEKVVANRADAQDAVAAAFASTFLAIRKGGGPDKAFTPYLMAAVRNAALQIVRTKRYSSEVVTEDAGAALTHMDVYEIGADPAVRDAFQDLPVRWREVLWKTEIEGTPARALSDEMQMSPASIAALAKRARDGFRAAYLASALGTDPHEWAIARLDLLREGALDARTRDLVELHVEHCAICQGELAPLPVPMASIGVILLVGGAVQPVGGVGAAVAGSALLAKLRHLRSRTIGRMSTQLATVSAATVAIAGTLLVVAISARSPSSSPASGAVPTVESTSSGASATTATAGSVRLPGGASDGSPPGTDVGAAGGTGAGSTPTVSAESSPPNVPGPPPRGGAVTTPHGPTTSVTTAGSTVVIAPGSTPGATTSGATTTITGGLPGTTATVAGAPFIPPASTAPGATTAPGPVTLAPPVAPTTSSTTTGASTATTDPLGSTTLAPILAIEPPARPGPPVTETTTTTASVLPPTTEPATTVADPAQYGGTLSLRRSGTSTRTVTVAATARDGLPDDTVMTLTFSSVDPQWSVTFTSIDRCVGLPAALSGDDAHSYTVQCVIPALAASATSSVAFVVDDPSHDGDDNDAVRARVTGQRPGGSAATQCDGPGC